MTVAGDKLVGNRGQSEVVGIVLLFAIVLSVSLTVVVVGTGALDDARSATETEDAEISLSEFQSAVDEVSSGDGSVQRVSFAESESAGGDGAAPAANSEGGNEGTTIVDPDAGSIQIEVNGNSIFPGGNPVELGAIEYERDGEKLAYQGGGVFRTNGDSETSSLVSPPPIDYQYQRGTPSMSFPIHILDTSAGDLSGTAFTLQEQSSMSHLPSDSISNPLDAGDTFRIEVQSEYYRAWGAFFEERTDGDVNYHVGQTVSLELDGPSSPPTGGANGAVITSDIGTFGVSNHVKIDSYDSSTGPPGPYGDNAPTRVLGELSTSNHFRIDGHLYIEGRAVIDSHEGSPPRTHVEGKTVTGTSGSGPTKLKGNPYFGGEFHTEGDLWVEGKNNNPGKRVELRDDVYVGGDVIDGGGDRFRDVEVTGDMYVQGDVDLGPNAAGSVSGDIIAGGAIDIDPGASFTVGGTTDEHADPPEPIDPDTELQTISAVDGEIDSNENRIKNNEDSTPYSTEIQTEWMNCNPCELDAGNYAFEEGIEMSPGDTLRLDTSGGDIDIYAGDADGDGRGVYLRGAEIVVEGDNRVNIYNDANMEFTNGGGNGGTIKTVDSAGSRTMEAPEAWIYMNHGADANLNGDAIFTGVLYGPGDPDGTGITLSNHVEVHGAVVGEITSAPNHVNIHYDEALESASVSGGGGAGGPQPDKVGYVRITSTEIEVTGE